MEDPSNCIKFEINCVPNEPFTLFNNKTRQIIAQGQLDQSGHAYVEIEEQTVFLVDVAFHKTKEYRSWYYMPIEIHGQMLGGSMDALASSLDTINDIHLAEIVPIAKPYNVLNLTKYFSPNSAGGSKIIPSLTKNGELIRAVSAFITEFYLLDLVGFSYIKPTSQFGQFVKGMASFGIINAVTTPVMKRRITDLLSKDLGLKNAVIDYLSAHPDDSNAQARFKNLLEGLALGALLEPLFIVFRIIKSTLTRTLIERIPTRRTYKLEAEKVEVEEIIDVNFADLQAGTIRNINPNYPLEGWTHNCVNCAIATDATLAGNPASALPIYSREGVSLSVLEKHYGSKFQFVNDPNNIIEQMKNAGTGSRGIVFGSYGPGQPGHVFNVVNQNGVIRFLDGQTGKIAEMGQFKSFKLLRTNK